MVQLAEVRKPLFDASTAVPTRGAGFPWPRLRRSGCQVYRRLQDASPVPEGRGATVGLRGREPIRATAPRGEWARSPRTGAHLAAIAGHTSWDAAAVPPSGGLCAGLAAACGASWQHLLHTCALPRMGGPPPPGGQRSAGQARGVAKAACCLRATRECRPYRSAAGRGPDPGRLVSAVASGIGDRYGVLERLDRGPRGRNLRARLSATARPRRRRASTWDPWRSCRRDW